MNSKNAGEERVRLITVPRNCGGVEPVSGIYLCAQEIPTIGYSDPATENGVVQSTECSERISGTK